MVRPCRTSPTTRYWRASKTGTANGSAGQISLKDNWEQISRFKGTVFTTSFVNQLETFCEPIMPALRRLDNKDRYCHDAPDKDDILDVIEAVHKDEKTEALFMEAFNACGPVLMMAIHVIAFNCLLHNPEALAEQSVKNAATDALRTNPSKQNVNQYLIDSILQKRRTVQRSTDNLWDRSLYSAGTDSPAKQNQQARRRCYCRNVGGLHYTQETSVQSPEFCKAPTVSRDREGQTSTPAQQNTSLVEPSERAGRRRPAYPIIHKRSARKTCAHN